MKTLLTAIYALLGSLNPAIASVFSVAVTTYAVFTWVNDQWALMIAKIDLMAQANFAGTLNLSPLALLNTFVPLTETLSYVSAWLAVLGIATTIRIVKSFVPTLGT